MRRAVIRNAILGISGTLTFLTTIVFFDLGCTGSDDNKGPVATVELNPPSTTLLVGRTAQLTAITRLANGTQVNGRFCTWFSSNDHIVSISENGVATAIAEGTVTITAVCEQKTGTAQVTVSPVAVATIEVSPSPATVKRDYTTQMTAVVKDANGNVLLDRLVTWSTISGTGSASIDNQGLVTGGQAGTVQVVATSELKTGAAQLTVTPNPVASVVVEPNSVSLPFNTSSQLFAKTFDSQGHEVFFRDVTWISGAPGIVDVTPPQGSTGGVAFTGIHAYAEGGPVTITATSEGQTGFGQVTVPPIGPPGVLSGRVINYLTGASIGGATVTFFTSSGSTSLGTSTSAADGSFTSPPLTNIANGVWIQASQTGFVPGHVFVATVPPNQTTFTEPIPLVPDNNTVGGIAGVVRNARTGQGITGATVTRISFSDPSPRTVTSGANGAYQFDNVPPGTYQLSASATGFQTTTRTGVAVGQGNVTGGQDLVLSPTGTNDIRIVLTWGTSPNDLDSHLTGPNADATRFHVYYGATGNLTAAPFAKLDIDDVSGSGPETITITQFNSGNYRYSIHDFSNRSSNTSAALGQSGAKVQVYSPTALLYTAFVPPQPGTLWTVFEMTGSIANPVITPRNFMSFTSDPAGITSPPVSEMLGATDAAWIARAIRFSPKAPH